MSGSLIGALRVTLGIDTAAFEQGLGLAQKKLGAAGKSMQAFGDRMTGIGQTMSVAVTAPLVAFGVSAVQAANESAAAMAQVNAALESMGPVAGKTSEQLQKAAEDLQHLSTFDDDDILKSVTANMLTFGNVTGDTFDRAQQAALNLSARLGQDLQSSAIQVGKALNDPIKGITALGRVGVSFTEQQKAQIRAMTEAGDVAGAQAIILGELEKQYGGAAKAARDATPGADTVDAWRNFQETVGAIVAQVLPPLTNILTGVLEAFNNLDPGTQTFIVGLAAAAAAVGPVLMVVGTLTSAIGGLLPVFAPVIALIGEVGLAGALGAAATAAAPFIAAAAALAAGWALFGDKIGPVLEALKTKFQEVLGPKLQSLFNTVKTTLTELWNGPFGEAIRVVIGVLGDFGAAYTSILGEALIRIVSALVSAVEAGFKIVGDVLGIVGALLTGDFSAAWEGVKSLVGNVISGVVNILKSLAPEAVAAVKSMASAFATWLGDLAGRMVTYGRNIIQGLVSGILAAPEAVWNALKSVVLRGVENIREFLGIASPSRLFVEMGGFVTDGLALGIEGGIGVVERAMGALSEAVGNGLPLPPLEVRTTFAPPDDPANDNGKPTEGDVRGSFTNAADDMRENFRRTFSDGVRAALNGDLGGFFENWFKSLSANALEDALNSVSDLLFDLISGVFGGGSGASGGGLFDAIGSAIMGLFGGKAIGGPVMANTPYIVGEKRPELFVPSTAGRIVPNLNGDGRGSSGTAPYFDLRGAVVTADLLQQMNDISRRNVASGLSGYDRSVGSRVKDNLARRG